MSEQVRVGIGIMVLNGNQILLGHRCKDRKDTGGIIGLDVWALPGGKQEFKETMFETAIREVKEETNLDVSDLVLFGATDDIGSDRHYVTLHIIAYQHSGELKVMEPTKEDEWRWFDLDHLPDNIYSSSKKFIDRYLEDKKSNG